MKIRPWVVAAWATHSLLAPAAVAFSPLSTAVPNRNIHGHPRGVTTPKLSLSTEDATEKEIQQQQQQRTEEFVNKGPMAWMQQFLDIAGVVPGQTIAYGPFTTGAVKESDRKPPKEAARLREEATKNLQNIDMEERNRRKGASEIMTVLTVVYALWATFLGDQGDLTGHVLRFGTIFPLFLAVGYRLSADTGL